MYHCKSVATDEVPLRHPISLCNGFLVRNCCVIQSANPGHPPGQQWHDVIQNSWKNTKTAWCFCCWGMAYAHQSQNSAKTWSGATAIRLQRIMHQGFFSGRIVFILVSGQGAVFFIFCVKLHSYCMYVANIHIWGMYWNLQRFLSLALLPSSHKSKTCLKLKRWERKCHTVYYGWLEIKGAWVLSRTPCS